MTDVLIERRNLDVETNTRHTGRTQVKMRAVIRVTIPLVKEGLKLPANKRGERYGTDSPSQPSQENSSTLILDFQAPELRDNKLFKPPSLLYFVTAALAN